MTDLRNKVNRKELKAKIKEDPTARTTVSFYKYFKIENPQEFRDTLFATWSEWDILGRVYVAAEGINAQISIPSHRFDQFQSHLTHTLNLKNIILNTAIEDNGKSFAKLTIKVKQKIVADGLDDSAFDVTDTGKHIDAEAFNKLSGREDTVIIDMRNHYETEVGYFQNAIKPDVDTFREALPETGKILEKHKDKNIVMYCTGGIRCEKASAYFKYKGFKHVHQLKGGIIQYAREVKEKGLPNKFIGKNFVFDERLGERITNDIVSHCHQCGKPCDTHTNCKNDACHLLFIQCDECAREYNGCCSEECLEINRLPLEEQKAIRKQQPRYTPIFTKGRPGWNLFKHAKHKIKRAESE